MTDKHLYEPEGFEWERLPTDLSTAVEQWWESLYDPTEQTQVFLERACEKIPMPSLDCWLERLAEEICDDTFLDHDDYKHVDKIMQQPDVLAAGEALFGLIHSKVDFWQAGDVARKITVLAWPTGEHSWNWTIVDDG